MVTTYTREAGMVIDKKKPAKESADFWMPKVRPYHDRFEASLRKSHAEAIALGKALIEAKEALPHGEFGRLFSGHENPAEGHLPFQARWAQKLMTTAAHPILSNASHASHLPSDLEAMHALATMKAAELTAAIESGKVTPSTTRKEAKEIKAEFAEPKREKRETQPEAQEKTDKRALEDFMADITSRVTRFRLDRPQLTKVLGSELVSLGRSL